MSSASVPIIVTRAEPGAGETATALENMGLTVLRAPALSLEPLAQVDLPDVETLAGIVFTSANGVRTYAEQRADRSLTAWCVGPATAAAANEAGFSDVRESSGNAVDLAHFIARHTHPSDQPLLHVANAAATGTLKQTLTELGFQVLFVPLYAMRPIEALPADLIALIERGAPAILLIHSAKGAAAIAALVDADAVRTWTLVAISDQAAQPLATITQTVPYIANVPNETGLMQALTQALATLSA